MGTARSRITQYRAKTNEAISNQTGNINGNEQMGDSIFVSSGDPLIAEQLGIDFESDPHTVRERLTRKRDILDFAMVYQTKQELGEGITGRVFKLVDRQGQERAMKMTYGYDRTDKPQVKELRSEIKLLRLLDHPNIARLVEYYETPSTADERLILDMCKGGNLASASGIARLLGSESRIAFVVFQLLLAIRYLHDRGIAHRDIKEENVMFVSSDRNSAVVQLIDFGLSAWRGQTLRDFQVDPQMSHIESSHSVSRLRTFCGTLPYLSPEVLRADYDFHSDLWSLGVLVFELVTGSLPFTGSSDRKLLKQIRKARIDYSSPAWSNFHPGALELVQHLLVANPAERWSAAFALKCTWFTQYRMDIEHEESRVEQKLLDLGLCRYAKHNPFKQLAMQVLAHFSPPAGSSLELVNKCFIALDVDDDGVISKEELLMMLRERLGEDDDDNRLGKLFNEIDYDGRGKLTWSNFIAVTMEAFQQQSPPSEAEASANELSLWSRAFDYLSRGRHQVSIEQVKELLHARCTEEVSEMMENADQDHDGWLSKNEFLGLVTGMGDSDVVAISDGSSMATVLSQA